MNFYQRKPESLKFYFFSIITFLFLFSACGGGDNDGTGSAEATGELTFRAVYSDDGGHFQRQAAVIDCEGLEIATIEAGVYDANNAFLVGGGPWGCDQGQGSIAAVPAGRGRTVVLVGRNQEGGIVFRGQKADIDVIGGGENNAGTIMLTDFVPRLQAPADGAQVSGAAMGFAWNAVEGATQYRLIVSEQSDLSDPLIYETMTTPNFTPSVLSNDKTYYWCAIAGDMVGNTGLASHVWSLTVNENHANTPPEAHIVSPTGNTTFTQGDAVSFSGNGSDSEDGALTGASLQWSSDIDGQLGMGTAMTLSTLSQGTHQITLSAIDQDGATGKASVSISVIAPTVNTAPTAHITAPSQGSTYTVGQSVNFAGSGQDSEDGTLSSASLVWSSDIDGQLGTGTAMTLSTLSQGTHQIILTATDSQAATGTDTVTIIVVQPRPQLVKDINPGAGDGLPLNFTEYGDYLFFTAYESEGAAMTLWRSDGTSSGTQKIGNAQDVSNLIVVGTTLYFSANTSGYGNELCRIDDSTTAQISVIDVVAGTSGSFPNFITAVNDKIYFVTSDGLSQKRLTVYTPADGQVQHVYTVVKLSSITNLFAIDSVLYFTASESVTLYGMELWRCVRPEDGADLVLDINSGVSGSYPAGFVNLNSTMIFIANNGTNGYELWRSGGTGSSTSMLKDICPGEAGSRITGLTRMGDNIYFFADDTDDGILNRHLWRTDGTAGGTVPVEEGGRRINIGGYGSFMVSDGTEIYFRAVDPIYGDELHRSDGTVAGTYLVRDIWPGATGSFSRNADMWDFIYYLNGLIYFRATDEAFGTTAGEIWFTDGTAGGTDVIDVVPGSGSSFPTRMGSANGTVFFSVNDGTHGYELWKYAR